MNFGIGKHGHEHDSSKKVGEPDAHEKAPDEKPAGHDVAPSEGKKDTAPDADTLAKPAAKFKFQLLADKEADFLDRSFIRDFRIGHAWIRLLDPEGSYNSWGYWPDIAGGHAVNPMQPWKSVPGKVRSPDDSHSPTAMHTYEVDHAAAERVQKAAAHKMASPGQYNLLTYNCVDFAAEMAHAAGVSAPSHATLGIANPNALFAGLTALNKHEGKDGMEHALPGSGAGGGGGGGGAH